VLKGYARPGGGAAQETRRRLPASQPYLGCLVFQETGERPVCSQASPNEAQDLSIGQSHADDIGSLLYRKA
jgi:hypothetical protein